MKVVLHIGMSKTGTSALQRSLRLAAADPATWPIAYPTWPAEASSHHQLASLYLSERYLPRVLTRGGQQSPAEAVTDGEQAWKAIARAIEATDAGVVVVSSELLFGIGDAEVADLAERFASTGADVEVAAYVRPPAAHYVAALSQRVRASRDALRPVDHRMQLASRLGRWADAFDGRLTVRPYDRARLIGGDLIEDFRATYLPEAPPLPRPPAKGENSSLSPEGICIVHQMRAGAWPDEDGDLSQTAQTVLEVLGRTDDAGSAGAGDLVEGLADAITWAHDVDLAVLEDRFGVELCERVDPPNVPCPAWTSDDPCDILRIDRERAERLRWRLLRGVSEQLATARGRLHKLNVRVAAAEERRRTAEAELRKLERTAERASRR